jgi:hypothetical protein
MVSFYPYLIDTSIRTHRLRVCFGGAEQHRNHGVSNLTHGEQIGKCAVVRRKLHQLGGADTLRFRFLLFSTEFVMPSEVAVFKL